MNLPAPDRKHADELMTWITGVLSRLDSDGMADLQKQLFKTSAKVAFGNDDDKKVIAILTEIGFYAVIDNMLEIINLHEENQDGTQKPE